MRDQAFSDQAIDWLVRLGSGRATDEDRAAFTAWRQRSPTHAAAAAEAEALLQAIGETRNAAGFRRDAAPVLPFRPPPAARLTRRAILGGSVAASAAAVVGGSGVFGPLARLYSDYSTGVGERRRIALADGSVVWLNTASALSLDYTGAARRLALNAGEAMFEVAKDPSRPFIVAAANGETRAVGTVFAVRRDAATTDVTVTEGIVEIRCGGEVPVRVGAGQRVAYGAAAVGRPESIDTDAATAWQRGKLIFNRRPLGEVAAELQRYQNARIVVTDSELEALRVTGVFDLDDPDLLLRTVAKTTGAHLVRLPFLTLIRAGGAA
ncbi:MAG TPA: FecR domain-containing protein [Stellaceae bacterium]|nr:FecR domain-containing protein [Stellaceae bacterium]